MATSAATTVPYGLDGVEIAAAAIRRLNVSGFSRLVTSGTDPLAARSGVLATRADALAVSAAGGMDLSVAVGWAVVQGTESAGQGCWVLCLDAAATLTTPAADPSNGRIDRICMRVVDNGDGTSTYTVQIVEGTPAGTPAAPAAPDNSLTLALVTVGAGVTSIVAGNISDQRVWTGSDTGILPVASSATYPTAGPTDRYLHDIALGQLMLYEGGTVYQPGWCRVVANYAALPSNKKTGALCQTADTDAIYLWDGAAWVFVTDTVWQSYTPVWTASGTAPAIGNGTIVGEYFRTGRSISVRIRVTFGGSSTYGTGSYYLSLPVSPTATLGGSRVAAGGIVHMLDTSETAYRTGFPFITSSDRILIQNIATNTFVGQLVPHTWASTDWIEVGVAYEW